MSTSTTSNTTTTTTRCSGHIPLHHSFFARSTLSLLDLVLDHGALVPRLATASRLACHALPRMDDDNACQLLFRLTLSLSPPCTSCSNPPKIIALAQASTPAALNCCTGTVRPPVVSSGLM